MATAPRTRDQRDAGRQLDIETADAWFEYLDTTATAVSYTTVEPWAWARLQQRLSSLRERRRSRERRTA